MSMKTFHMFQRITENAEDSYIFTYKVKGLYEILLFESKDDEQFWRAHFQLEENEWILVKTTPA